MQPPAYARPAALGGMPHWFSPPGFANAANAKPPMPAAAPSAQARCYSRPSANIFTDPPLPPLRATGAPPQHGTNTARGGRDLDGDLSSQIDISSQIDFSSQIDLSHLAALSAVPDSVLAAQLGAARPALAAKLQRECNAARPAAPPVAPRAVPITPDGAHDESWLLDSLTAEDFVSLRSASELDLSSPELELSSLAGFPCGPSSLDSTLMEDAGRLNLSSLSGLAGLLGAL